VLFFVSIGRVAATRPTFTLSLYPTRAGDVLVGAIRARFGSPVVRRAGVQANSSATPSTQLTRGRGSGGHRQSFPSQLISH
jgi:hypothetical protein